MPFVQFSVISLFITCQRTRPTVPTLPFTVQFDDLDILLCPQPDRRTYGSLIKSRGKLPPGQRLQKQQKTKTQEEHHRKVYKLAHFIQYY